MAPTRLHTCTRTQRAEMGVGIEMGINSLGRWREGIQGIGWGFLKASSLSTTVVARISVYLSIAFPPTTRYRLTCRERLIFDFWLTRFLQCKAKRAALHKTLFYLTTQSFLHSKRVTELTLFLPVPSLLSFL